MSNRSKGFRNERRCEEELKKDGWETYRVKGSTRFNKNVDLFDLFDLIALKKGDHISENFNIYGMTKVKLIQVKTNKKADMNELIKFKRKYPDLEIEMWTWWVRGKRKKKHGWEKIIVSP